MSGTQKQTGFKSIGCAGRTVDGREIKPEWIQEAIESYNPKLYTAVINLNHWDPKYYGTYGQVCGMKAGKGPEGELSALASLEPNERLMALSKREVLFASMEIEPNFRDSGKAYLVGLAVTPRPASVGTEQMKFACNDARFGVELFGQQTSETAVMTDFVPFDFAFTNQDSSEEGRVLAWLKKTFSGSSSEDETQQEEHDVPALDKDTAEKLATQLAALNKNLQTFGQQSPKAGDVNPQGVAPQQIIDALGPQLEQFGIQLSAAPVPQTLEQKVDGLLQEFAAFKSKQSGTDANAQDDAAGDDTKQALAEFGEQLKSLSSTLNFAIHGEKPGTQGTELFGDNQGEELV